MKKGPLTLSVIQIILLITSIVFINKNIYIATNLSISISLFVYAFTFLIPVILINKSKLKDAKNLTSISSKGLLLFLLLITILSTISGNLETMEIEDSLRNVLAPNSYSIGNIILHYPNLNIVGIVLVYYFSHTILISVYEALNDYTNKYLSYALALFIAFIIDTMFLIPLIYIKDIYYANIDMLGVIKYLTAGFMVVIVSSLIMILIFSLYINKKEKKN